MFEEQTKPETTLTVHDYLQIFRRRRWWLLGSLFICWVVAFGASRIMPSVYRSETLILIEQQKIPEQYVVANTTIDLNERLERIIKKFNLYEKLRSRVGPDGLVEQMRKDIQIQLVEAPGKRQLTAFRISYSAPNAATAQQVATQLTSLFIDEEIQEQSLRAESTTEFLSSELNTARSTLTEQEAKIKQYKGRYLGELPSQMDSNVRILTGLQDRYQNLNQIVNRAQEQKLYLESLLNQYKSVRVSGDKGMTTLPALEQELGRLRASLADAQTRYTDKHPDVIALKGRIAETERLQKRIEAELASSGGEAGRKPPTTTAELQAMSPILQLEGQLKANEQEVNDARRQQAVLQQQITMYQARLNQAPVREQQLSDLTRDYEQSKANYDSLLRKQMQSQLATNLEKRQQGKGFRIIDPPSLPQKPVSPDRVRFSLVGLLAGVLVGLGLTAAAEFVDDRVRSEDEITRMVKVRVLSSIPHLTTSVEERAQNRRRVLEWCGAVLILIAITGGNVYTFYRG